MARTQYSFQKRMKEIARKEKQALKRQRRLEKKLQKEAPEPELASEEQEETGEIE